MTRWLGFAIMAVARRCWGERRRDWADAMATEFAVAEAEGHGLSFALGCLVAAGRALPMHEEGRLALTSYGLAIGLMIPMAALQIGCALLGFPYLFAEGAAIAAAGGAREALFGDAYRAAVPALLALPLLLGAIHLRLAWMLLDRDWPRITTAGTLAAAAATTLVLFMGALFLDGRQVLLQGGVLAIELAAMALLARWHADLAAP